MTDLSPDRLGMLTCSELHRVLRADGKLRTGDGPQTYLLEKLAEWWLGRPLRAWSGSGGPVEQGNILEEEAIPWYELEHGCTLVRPGFLVSRDGLLGGTPDAMVAGVNTGVEIKCPQDVAHLRYLLSDEIPDEYRWQMQGYMYVTGAQSWTFVSYHRSWPRVVRRVIDRDQEDQDAIRTAAEWWRDELSKRRDRLQELAALQFVTRPERPKPPKIAEEWHAEF